MMLCVCSVVLFRVLGGGVEWCVCGVSGGVVWRVRWCVES